MFTIKQDARGPTLDATLTTAAGVQDLTGGTVTFWMEDQRTGTIKVSGAAVTVLDAAAGSVRYSWAAADTDTPGTYRGEFQLAGLTPTPVRFPSGGYIYISVLPKVA
jgi:hypothetical protein